MSVQVGLIGVDVPLPSVEIDDEWLKAPLRGRSQGGRKEDPCGGTTGAGASPRVERPVCCKRTFRAWGVSPPPKSPDQRITNRFPKAFRLNSRPAQGGRGRGYRPFGG